ncbi:MAG TPA: nucleoside deaminase [Blastocatellia bacterium]|nr:nucleoside deaminase [Blastocatellia bacterium]
MNQNELDLRYIRRAIRLALDSEQKGNLPVGALIVLDDKIIAEAGSSLLVPVYHPGRHAETEALRAVPVELWTRSREMTCYTTLEPCLMCFGSLLLHGIGRIVYGASDTKGGSSAILNSLPEYYSDGVGVPKIEGPALPEECDELYRRTAELFDSLPCGSAAMRKC